MAQAKIKSVYETLSSLSIKDKVERKGKLDYLSWANAWHMLKQKYPTAQRKVYEHEHTGFNYFTDGRTAWVKVGIVVGDIEHIDMLPIMDFRNNSISVDKLSSMDVNKAIQRSTAKAIAMHGLGLSLWTGEDVPELTAPPKEVAPKLIALKVGDANWKKVEPYIVANKTTPLADIIKTLGAKYTQSSLKVAEKAIKKLLTT
jgi:hypothetical protein